MYLQKLILSNFRSFTRKEFKFGPHVTLFIGPNAIGKTNILEAIYLAATGKSFRASHEPEMIFNAQEWGSVTTYIKDAQNNSIKLEIMVTSGNVQGKSVAYKLFKVNGVGRRWKDFAGKLKCVLFRPEDIDLVLGSPGLRRNYLDLVLEQADWQYRACNLAYQKGLRQRNKLLDRIRDGEAQKTQLIFWDQLLIKNGEIIQEKRANLIDFFNQFLAKCQGFYKESQRVSLMYDKSAITQARLDKYYEPGVALGITLVGPHRDNIKFQVKPCNVKQIFGFNDNRDLGIFGSRGEQRMAILATKLAELEFLQDKTHERPILLLDDIFSELDIEHREQIFKIIPNQQTIITATDAEAINGALRDKIEVMKL